MSTVDRDTATSASTKSFETSLWLNAAVFGIMIVSFTVLRKRFKTIYEPRTFLTPENKRSPSLSSHLLAWPLAVWKADYHDILRQNGMDAFFFVHFLRMLTKILLPIWLISWVVLLPLTSVNMNSGKTGLDKFTFGSVTSDQSKRYAGHIILAWFFTIWIGYNIKKEMSYFVTTRQLFLVSPEYASTAQANTILVTGVPRRLLSERSLAKLFSYLPGGVKQVWLNRDLKELPDLYDRRMKACNKLESAETALLKAATKAYAKQVKADAKSGKGNDKEHGPPTLESLVPEKDRPSHKLPPWKLPFALPFTGTKVDTIEWARKEIEETTAELEKGRATLRREADFSKKNEAFGTGAKVGGMMGLVSKVNKFNGKSQETDSQSLDENTVEQEYPPLNSAFILFHNQIAAHLAASSLIHHGPYQMSDKYINVAPDDVIWGNLGLNPYEKKIRLAFSYAATAGLIILWAFPVAFCGALSNITGLSEKYHWLSWLGGLPPTVTGLIQGILPQVLLAVLMMLLPIVLRLLAKFEGIPRKTGLELSLMTRYFLFQIIHGFLIVTLSSGIIAALPQLTSNPTSIPSILAENLPQASNFFLTYIILQGLSGTAGGFLQAVPLIIYYAKLFILGSTPRSVYSIKYTLRSVAWGTLFPAITLITAITITYSVISPIINGLACFSFFLFYMLYKYLFLYQLDQPPAGDTGGLFFPKAMQHLFVGLYIQQICLAALFFLAQDENKKPSAVPEGALMIVLIIFTIGFHLIINNSYGPLINYLPLSLAEKANGYQGGSGNAQIAAPPSSGSRLSSESSIAKQRAVEGSTSGAAGKKSSDVASYDAERTERAGLVRPDNEESGETEEEHSDFHHPAAVEPQRVIWIPTDRLGFSKGEVKSCIDAGVDASSDHAEMNEKGHVDINDHPPEKAQVQDAF